MPALYCEWGDLREKKREGEGERERERERETDRQTDKSKPIKLMDSPGITVGTYKPNYSGG
jgi:hypothetical protein